MAAPSDFVEDGHLVHFRWDTDEIHITHIDCPHDGKTGMCNKLRENCLIRAFVSTYGPELNIGSVSIDGPVEIAWCPVPGECDVDREYKHVWIIPVKDPDFVAAKFMEAEQTPE